jgi:glycosyltransferase 2 family protein
LSPSAKSWLVTAAKLAIASVILWLLLRELDLAALGARLAGASGALLAIGFLLNVGTVLIAGLRWKRLVQAAGLPLRWRDLTCIAFIGQFFATFLPGPLGDDITRMVYVGRATGIRAPLALSSVVVDRVIGLSVILLLALFVTPPHLSILQRNPQTALLGWGIVIGGALVLAVWALFFLLPKSILHQVGRGLVSLAPSGPWRQQSARFAAAYLDHRSSLAVVMVFALTTQLLLCLMFMVAGLAVGIHLPTEVWLGFVPVVLAANALPVTIAGLGVREYLMALFLSVFGAVPAEQAIACSFAALAMMLCTNLAGGLVYIFFRSARTSV